MSNLAKEVAALEEALKTIRIELAETLLENERLSAKKGTEPRKVLVIRRDDKPMRGFFMGLSSYGEGGRNGAISPVAFVEFLDGHVGSVDPTDLQFVNPTEWREDATEKSSKDPYKFQA